MQATYSDKHSRLLRNGINYSCKSFILQTPCVVVVVVPVVAAIAVEDVVTKTNGSRLL